MNISVLTSIIGHNQSWCSRRASKAQLLPVFASSASSQDPESAPPEHQIMDQNNLRDFTMLVLPCCFISTLYLLLFLLLHVRLLDDVQEQQCVLQGAPCVSFHILRDRVVHLHLKVRV